MGEGFGGRGEGRMDEEVGLVVRLRLRGGLDALFMGRG